MFFISGGIALLALLFIVPLVIFAFVFWAWMLVSAIRNPGLTDGEKVAWVIVIVFLHFLGTLLYLCLGRSKRKIPVTA